MTNQEAADELQHAIDLIKQDGKDWLDERDIPILEAAISALQEQEAKRSTGSSLTQRELDESKEHGSKLEPKCETCQHNSNEWDEEPCDFCKHQADCGDMALYCPAERKEGEEAV